MNVEHPIKSGSPRSKRARTLHRFAVGGAWFFIATSLVFVAWVVGVKWSDPSGLTTLYQTTVGDETYRSLGLAYSGIPGLIIAMTQVVVIFAAAVASVAARRPWRGIAHGVLIAWSALWMIDLAYLAALDHQIDTIIQAGLLVVLCACTTYRAFSRPQPARGSRPLPEPEAPSDATVELSPDHIASSDAVRDVTPPRRRAIRIPAAMLSRVKSLMSGAPERARSIGAKLKAGLAGAGRRARRHLRRNGVIPDPDRTSAPRSMPR